MRLFSQKCHSKERDLLISYRLKYLIIFVHKFKKNVQIIKLNVLVGVCVQVSSSPASLQLLSILQTLLVLGPGRPDIWLALEAITNRAILLAQDCESAQQQQCFHSRSTL